MGINIYPTPTTLVEFDGTQNVSVQNASLTTTVTNTVLVSEVERQSLYGSYVFSLTDNSTPQNFVILGNPVRKLVIYSITLSQHLFGNQTDRLGVTIHTAGTAGNSNDYGVIAASYEDKGSVTFNFGSGLKLSAGVNLYLKFRYLNSGMSINGVATVVYSEVTA